MNDKVSYPGDRIILLDGDRNLNSDDPVVYWSKLSVPRNSYSVPSMVEEQGEQLKDLYIKAIYEIGQCDIKGQTIPELMRGCANFSFWWMSLLVEKSPWKSKQIFSAFKAIALKNFLQKHNIKVVDLYSSNPSLQAFLRLWAGNNNELIIHDREVSERQPLTNKLPNIIIGCAYWLKFIVDNKAGFFRNPGKRMVNSATKKQISIFGYSDNIDAKSLEKGEFKSAYWGDLHSYLNDSELAVNWLMLFAKSKIMGGLAEGLRVVDNKLSRQSKDSFTFIEEWLSPGVVTTALINFCKVAWRTRHLGNFGKRISSVENFEAVSVFLQRDWLTSIRGKTLMENCLKQALFEVAVKDLNHQQCALYVSENQAWERALCSSWKQNSNGPICSFQHVSGRFFDLRLFNDPGCFQRPNYPLPEPDIVAVTGQVAKQMMLDTQYPQEKIKIVEALRYQYLLEQKISHKQQNVKRLLVITDYISSVTEFQLQLLESALLLGEVIFDEIIIKPHPNTPVEPVMQRLNVSFNFEIVDTPLGELWDKTSVAYVGNTTNSALEAARGNIPVVISLDESSFNMSPLRGIESVCFAGTGAELSDALLQAQGTDISDSYFFLSRPLQKWPEVLKSMGVV